MDLDVHLILGVRQGYLQVEVLGGVGGRMDIVGGGGDDGVGVELDELSVLGDVAVHVGGDGVDDELAGLDLGGGLVRVVDNGVAVSQGLVMHLQPGTKRRQLREKTQSYKIGRWEGQNFLTNLWAFCGRRAAVGMTGTSVQC